MSVIKIRKENFGSERSDVKTGKIADQVVGNINAGVAEYKATNGAVLLDVRTVEEYRDGHIEGSINLPLDRITAIENTVTDKSTPLFVHCYSGSRSGQAVSYLKRMGYTNATNIGGIGSYRGKVVR